jgi:hypothetical protein
MQLACRDSRLCPDCGAPLRLLTTGQPPLLRHGGYGAQVRTQVRWCRCGYRLTVDRSEVRP